MKISEIQIGKKYWKGKTVMNGRSRMKEITGVAVYVLEVDTKKKKVLASLNGTPAEWFGSTVFARWKIYDPTFPKQRY